MNQFADATFIHELTVETLPFPQFFVFYLGGWVLMMYRAISFKVYTIYNTKVDEFFIIIVNKSSTWTRSGIFNANNTRE